MGIVARVCWGKLPRPAADIIQGSAACLVTLSVALWGPKARAFVVAKAKDASRMAVQEVRVVPDVADQVRLDLKKVGRVSVISRATPPLREATLEAQLCLR